MKKFLVLSLLVILPTTVFGMENKRLTDVNCCGQEINGTAEKRGYPYNGQWAGSGEQKCLIGSLFCSCAGLSRLLYAHGAKQLGVDRLTNKELSWSTRFEVYGGMAAFAVGALTCSDRLCNSHSYLCGRIKNRLEQKRRAAAVRNNADQQPPSYQPEMESAKDK